MGIGRRFSRWWGGLDASLLRPLLALSVGAILGSLILPIMLAGELYDYQDTLDGVRLPPVDSIVCLAGGRGRLAAAGDLWYRFRESRLGGSGPEIYISGAGSQATWPSLSKQLRPGVREVLAKERVILEQESVNTEANAKLLLKYVQGQPPDKRWKRIVLITSPYHMRRAMLIFEKTFAQAGVPMTLLSYSAFQEPFEPGEWLSSPHGIHVTLLEYLKWVYYRWVWQP